MIIRYLARRGLRITMYGEFMLCAAGLLFMGAIFWALLWVLA